MASFLPGALGLCAAWVAVGFTALRLASLAAPSGAERVLAAASVGVAFAVAESLALGLLGLGTSPVALLAGAAAVAGLARWRLPAPAVPLRDELPRRAAAGALLGIGGALIAWAWWSPAWGEDSAHYHLAEIQDWIATGRPGSVVPLIYGLPVGNYPLTGEVALGWSLALARSFAPVAPWMVLLAGLGLLGGWSALERLGVPVAARIAGLAALAATPLVALQLNTALTDLPAAAWLGVGGGLVAGVRARPALLPFALLALALAAGTKTTALPVAGGLALLGLWSARSRLRPLAAPLALAALASLVVGGAWYARNLIDHGSPFWPFVAAPWGTEQPALVAALDHSLLERPRATLEGRLAEYHRQSGGAGVLLLAAVLAPLLARTRAVALAAGATALSALLWAAAPVTGVGDVPELAGLATTTVRYLLPTLALAVVALGLAARDGPAGRRWAIGAGALAALVSLERLRLAGEPELPPVWLLLAGAAAGLPAIRLAPCVPSALPAVAAVALLALTGPGMLERHGARAFYYDQPVVNHLASVPGWDASREPVHVAPYMAGTFTGARLRHRVVLIPRDEPCEAVRARRGWVVLADAPPNGIFELPLALRCFAGRAPAFSGGGFRVYAP